MNQNFAHGRRSFLGQAAGLALASLSVLPARAQAQGGYPTRPIRLIVPFAPGGVTDTSGRIIAEYMSKRLGQQVVPDNRPGASGNIASQAAAGAEPDGYTLLLVLDGTFVINPHVYDKIPFDPIKDFVPIGKIGDSTTILVAHTGLKANTLREVIELSKTREGGLFYGTSGTGSVVHLAGELLKQRTGANLVHVPYKGGAPAIADAIAGHIPLAFASAASLQQHLKAGKLKAIAVPSGKRSHEFPDIPTFSESGVPNFAINSWVGLAAPARTSRPIVERLNSELNAALNDVGVRDRLAASGIAATPGTPEAFADVIHNDLALYGTIVKTAGIKMT